MNGIVIDKNQDTISLSENGDKSLHPHRVLIIGDSGVGKSAFLSRFTDGIFTGNHVATIGVEYKAKTVSHGNDKVNLQIWDSAGQERYNVICISAGCYRKALGVITVYDVTNATSFENIRNWLNQIDQHAPDDCKRMLVGNKSDLEDERQVSYEQGEEFAKEIGMQFLETSAKNDEQVSKAFEMMAGEIIKDSARDEFGNVVPKSGNFEKNVSVVLTENVETYQGDDTAGGCC